MKTHTPGPWTVHHRESGELVILSPKRSTIAEVFSVGDTRDQKTPLLNACLISASPKMLQILDEVADQLLFQIDKGGRESLRPILGKVLDVINHAKGVE